MFQKCTFILQVYLSHLLHLSLPLVSPVCAGRWLMSFWMGSSKIHELYTAACGLYVCWLSIRGFSVLLAWMPRGRDIIMLKVHEWTLMVMPSPTVMTKLSNALSFSWL